MKAIKAIFEIVDEINCPLYSKHERMILTDKTFACPVGREVCLILVRDMTQLLVSLLKEAGEKKGTYDQIFSCSGCTGLIKFRRLSPAETVDDSPEHGVVARIDTIMQEIHGRVVDSPFLRSLPADRLTTILETFQEMEVKKGSFLVREGEPNPNLYIVLEGSCIVENYGITIAELGEGEIFGEMSYLGVDVATSTVKATTDAVLLAIGAEDFGRLLNDCTSVQVFMARLLADRLKRINVARAKDFESCMSGKLDEVVPAELFQVFHMHQKTGVLSMELIKGNAKVSFREGCIINAKYDDKEHQEAIFEILAEKKGVYRFTTGLSPQEMKAAEIGDFMMLLMEGVRRVDEEHVIDE